MGATATSTKPTFAEALALWGKLGVLSFGGPAGQIALMHRLLVDERRWIGEKSFLHALNFCMLLPGPEAMQLATYVGWRLHGTPGGLAAGLLFVLPGAMVVLALSIAYALYGQVPLVEAAFLGVKAAVLVIVVEALLRVARRALRGRYDIAIAAAAFPAIFFFAVPFPLIIAAAALLGWLHALTPPAPPTPPADMERAPLSRTVKTASLWLAIWVGPLLVLAALFGRAHVTTDLALFFSKLAIVTFGGAYSVLAYMAQQAVETYGWLTPGEMLDGLGLAETTPAHSRHRIRWLPRRLPPWRRACARVRPVGRRHRFMGDLCAMLPVDLHRGALRRAVKREPTPGRGSGRCHRRRGRRHSESEPVVRAPRPVRQGHRRAVWPATALDTGLGHPQCRGSVARAPRRSAPVRAAVRHLEHARDYSGNRARLVSRPGSKLKLIRRLNR
jgi:putative chromate ion transporter